MESQEKVKTSGLLEDFWRLFLWRLFFTQKRLIFFKLIDFNVKGFINVLLKKLKKCEI